MSTPARTDSLRSLEQEVGKLMHRVRRVAYERAQAIDPELQGGAYLVLAYVADRGPTRASETCSAFDLDKSAVSRYVHQLIDLGLLDRTPDPADGRATLLTATEQAREALEEVTRRRRSRLREQLGQWDAEELAGFVATLRRYNEAIG